MLYDLTVECRRKSDPRITMRGLTHDQMIYHVRRLPPYATWSIRPIDVDQPRRLASPLVCYAWSPTGGPQSLAACRSVTSDLFSQQ